MEVAVAVRRMLLGESAVTSQTGTKVWRDVLEEGLEGSGGKAIVVSEQPEWATPDPVNTNEHPVVWVDCYADPTRWGDDAGDQAGLPRMPDAGDKAKALARSLMPIMHNKRGVRWGAIGSRPGLMIISSARLGWSMLDQGDMHKDEPSLGELVICRTAWALDVVHGTS